MATNKSLKKKLPKKKPIWERAYLGHAYWLGRKKLGKVTLLVAHNVKGKYQWEAAGKAGFTDALEKAKAAVEFAVLTADKQLDLFK